MPLLRLVRFAGIFPVLASVLTGYLLVRFGAGGEGAPRLLPFLLGAGACLYMANRAWADVFTAERDRAVAPDKPIPAGEISLTSAFLLAVVFSTAGVLLAMTAGVNGFLVAGGVLCIGLLQGAGLRQVELIGPLLAGGERAGYVFLGMMPHLYALLLIDEPLLFLPMILVGVYGMVNAILRPLGVPERPGDASAADLPLPSEMDTIHVELEPPPSESPTPDADRTERPPADPLPINALVLTVAGVSLLLVPAAGAYLMPRQWLALALLGILGALLTGGLYGAFVHGLPRHVRALTETATLGIVLLQAGLVASVASAEVVEVIPGLRLPLPSTEDLAGIVLVAAMLLPAWVLKRRLRAI